MINERIARDRTLIHEFGHALGLYHEQASPHFPDDLRVDVEKVVNAYMKKNPELDRDALTKKIASQNAVKTDLNKFGYSPYDKDSVMIVGYGGDSTKSGAKLVGGLVFSSADKAQLAKMYPPGTPPPSPSPIPLKSFVEKNKLAIIIGSVVGGFSLVIIIIIFVQLTSKRQSKLEIN